MADTPTRQTLDKVQRAISLVTGTETGALTIFSPLPEQRKAKATFWSYFATDIDAPLPDEISVEQAVKFSLDVRVEAWWNSRDFRNWFINRDEFRQRLEYLTHLALDAAEEILGSKTASPQAKVNMAKLVIEAANKMPSRQSGKSGNSEGAIDEKLAGMDKLQLEDYISKQLKQLTA